MCHKCGNVFLAVVILVFAFWQLSFSKWIIIFSAGLIFLWEIYLLSQLGCDGMCLGNCKTGSELMMEKSKEKIEPSKKEIKETLKK